MHVQCDDELYRVDRVFLGPKGKPWPVRATYRAWGLTLGLFFVSVIGWRILGLPWHVMLLAVFAMGAYPGGKWLDRHLTADRPISAELVRNFQEFVAPRPDLGPKEATYSHQLQVKRWQADAPLDGRWWARFSAGVAAIPNRVAGRLTGRRDGRVYVEGEWRDVR